MFEQNNTRNIKHGKTGQFDGKGKPIVDEKYDVRKRLKMNSMMIRMQNVGPHHKALCSSFSKRDRRNTYLEITVKIMLMILLVL